MWRKVRNIMWLISLSAFILVSCTGQAAVQRQEQIPQANDPALEAQNPDPASTEELPVLNLPQALGPFLGTSNFSFGVEINKFERVNFDRLVELGVDWIRYNGILWSDIEPIEGQYQWEILEPLNPYLVEAAQRGIKVILIVRGTPEWAQKFSGSFCSAVIEEKLAGFANFAEQISLRYGQEPLKIDYWEIGNEPDVDPALVRADSQFGCWGDQNDPYYGGEYYAHMLKAVTPALKRGNPEAQVLIGGLLLDCDPTEAGSEGRCREGYELPARFLEGIYLNGGGDYFDIISFHGYASYSSTYPNPLEAEMRFPNWAARGGIVMGKYAYIQELSQKYGIAKPVFLTETGFLCPNTIDICNPVGDVFFQKQAEYSTWLVLRNWAEGIMLSFWYPYDGPGWRSSSIMTREQEPKPIYDALKIVISTIQASQGVRRIENLPEGLLGYELSMPEKLVWVVTSQDNQAHALNLPENLFQIRDVYGNVLPLPGDFLEVYQPVYIDLSR
jgi:hypothetical protein